MSSYFHVIVRAPSPSVIAAAERTPRYRISYPKPTKRTTAHEEALESVPKAGRFPAEMLRARVGTNG